MAIFCFFIVAGVKQDGKDDFAINANAILAVYMVHAKNHGNVNAMRDGADFSATKISTTARIISHVYTVAPASTPVRDRTPAPARQASLELTARHHSLTVTPNPVIMVVFAVW